MLCLSNLVILKMELIFHMCFFISVFQWFIFLYATKFLQQKNKEPWFFSSDNMRSNGLDCHYYGNPGGYKVNNYYSSSGSEKEGMSTSYVKEWEYTGTDALLGWTGL